MRKIYLLSFALLLLAMPASSQKVSDVTVKLHDGGSWNLYSELKKGKAVIMDFWWVECGWCKSWAPKMEELYQFYGQNQKHVIVIGMDIKTQSSALGSTNDNAGIAKFKVDNNCTYPDAGWEGNGTIVRDYWQSDCYPITKSNGFTQAILIMPNVSDPSNNKVVWSDFGGISIASRHSVDTIKSYITKNNVKSTWEAATVSLKNEVSNAGTVFVFPNPSNGRINIHMENSSDNMKTEIRDLTGQLVYSQEYSNISDITISTLDFASGYYNLSIITADGISTKKIVVN